MFGALSLLTLLELASHLPAASAASTSDWQQLNSTLGGRLQAGIPYAQSCYSLINGNESHVPNPAECAAAQAGSANHTFRANTFGGYSLTQWETCQTNNDQCLLDDLNPTNPAAFSPPRVCSQGSVPSFFMDITGPEDVSAAFAFAKKTKRHDYLGRSSAPGSLALWLSFVPSFVPEGCDSSTKAVTAFTIGAGQQFADILALAETENVTFLSGADTTVGASGGWVQGGGGGTFGVVLESTFIVTPKIQVQVAFAQFSTSEDAIRSLIPALAASSVQWATDGWGGYIIPKSGFVVYVNPTLDADAAKKSMEPLSAVMSSIGGNVTFSTSPSYPSFFQELLRRTKMYPVGVPFAMATRLIPGSTFNNSQLIDAITDGMVKSNSFPQILSVAPFSYKGFDNMTSITPAWRDSIWHVIVVNTWGFNTTVSERTSLYQDLETLIEPIRKLTPGSGAYFNEADVYEPDFQTAYWGPNYPALLQIKQKYDPDGLLDCWHCVGWKGAQDPRYQCYLTI
ncbi:hypothetical protein BD779DRAFT_1529063 [Infundibulicybe gibba]|nr:hypothetical protein BD779DRAFT_1529063 [Infundibulicybe gibba]